jgi:hypothetical protein
VSDEVALSGGVANAGSVSRVGDVVHRPSTPFTESVQRFLRDVRGSGFVGIPEPLTPAPDGRERLTFIEGDVAASPYAPWAQTDDALASVADLMRRFHEAADGVSVEGPWNDDMADPTGRAEVVCHNDVCFENVVFRDGSAVALLDWEFAAPGRRVYDVAQMARMCVPVTDDESAHQLGWLGADRAARLRVVSDSYGLDDSGRQALIEALDDAIRVHGELVHRRVAAGDPNFTAMWNEIGGTEWLHRRQEWWAQNRDAFARALA